MQPNPQGGPGGKGAAGEESSLGKERPGETEAKKGLRGEVQRGEKKFPQGTENTTGLLRRRKKKGKRKRVRTHRGKKEEKKTRREKRRTPLSRGRVPFGEVSIEALPAQGPFEKERRGPFTCRALSLATLQKSCPGKTPRKKKDLKQSRLCGEKRKLLILQPGEKGEKVSLRGGT